MFHQIQLEEAKVRHKKDGVLLAVTISLAIAAVSGILILSWCYRKKLRTNVKGKIHISEPLLRK